MGYANRTIKYFKHLMVNATYTYTISVKPLVGDPKVFVKLSNTPVYPNPNDI